MTMIYWCNIISAKKLFREFRAWCPLCIHDQLTKYPLPYEPLLWTLEGVRVCTIHNVKLEDHCPICKKQTPYFHCKSPYAFCVNCNAFVGDSRNLIAVQNNNDLDLSNCIGRLITYEKKGAQPNSTTFIEKVGRYIKKNYKSNLSEFSKAIRVPEREVINIFCEGQTPRLETIAKICTHMKKSLHQIAK
ncbi:hypothetical protein A8708_25260 [Paenibacillus oryzisoli]|uniref:TniQ domain-containing protein n=2 Tax=Paenibacillus oryzisoli TaxID=1850517 RepID=A0A197ZY49_9BACL|nr:hypothetical protein A8708_25260 [Paenibacillus oryzisoli]